MTLIFTNTITVLPATVLPTKIQFRDSLIEYKKNKFQETNSKSWTFMVYLMGDDLQLEGSMIKYINQMESIGSNSNINIIVQIDYYNENNGDAIRYYIKNDSAGGSDLVENLGEVDMGDPNTLSEFANWAIERYPANRYSLVLGGHGKGWMGRLLRDESFPMSLTEFQDSLGDISEKLKEKRGEMENKIDLLIMLSCYMGMIEVCYQIKDYVNYYIATEGGFAVDYLSFYETTKILTEYSSRTSKEITQRIVDNSYDDTNKHILYGINLNKMDNTVPAIDKLAEIGKRNINNKEAINNAFDQSAVLRPSKSPYPYDLIELAKCYKLSFPKESSKCENIIEDINDLLIKPNGELYRDHWNGLSIFFLDENNSYLDLYKQLDFAKNTSWVSFLEKYYKSSSERRISRQILNIFEITNKNYFPILHKIFKFILLESK